MAFKSNAPTQIIPSGNPCECSALDSRLISNSLCFRGRWCSSGQQPEDLLKATLVYSKVKYVPSIGFSGMFSTHLKSQCVKPCFLHSITPPQRPCRRSGSGATRASGFPPPSTHAGRTRACKGPSADEKVGSGACRSLSDPDPSSSLTQREWSRLPVRLRPTRAHAPPGTRDSP